MAIHARWKPVLEAVQMRSAEVYGDRLVSLAVFGSVARGSDTEGSDLDLFYVLSALPKSRYQLFQEFGRVESLVQHDLSAMAMHDPVLISPVIRSTESVTDGTPLLLDMTEDAVILVDRQRFLANRLRALRERLHQLNARRIWTQDGRWYWDLRPGYVAGEVFEL